VPIIKNVLEDYYDAVFDTNRDKALDVIQKAREKGVLPEDIVFEVVVPAIERMLSDLTTSHDATLAQHFICSKVSAEVTDAMVPLFRQEQIGRGTVILGTARGDFHGLGKKIVGGCLKANMFVVEDLGINVTPEKFVDEAQRLSAGVIGVSSMMVHSAKGDDGARGVRKLLDQNNLQEKIKLVVGGAPYRFDSHLYESVGADGWADNAIEAVKIIDTLMK